MPGLALGILAHSMAVGAVHPNTGIVGTGAFHLSCTLSVFPTEAHELRRFMSGLEPAIQRRAPWRFPWAPGRSPSMN